MALKRYELISRDALLIVSDLQFCVTESGRKAGFSHGTSTPRHGNSIFVEIRDADIYEHGIARCGKATNQLPDGRAPQIWCYL